MPVMSSPNSQIELSYYTWPLIVTAMLLSVVCAGIYTIVIASRTPAQLVESSPYEKGLHFEETLKERKRAQHQRLVLTQKVIQDSHGETRFEVRLDADKLALSDGPQKISAKFMRPSSQELDFDTVLTATSNHLYSASIPEISPGLWHIEVRIISRDNEVSTYRYQSIIPSLK